jgi:hypothetical protein
MNAMKCTMLALLALCASAPVLAQGYPTAERVVYVQDCMRQHPGPHFEMLNKCACTLDKLASQVPHDEFVSMSTASNANSIGGERGNTIRDTELLQNQIRRFRQLQSTAKKSCFIQTEPQTR